nr:hypothetical protein [Sicyoidochytrium minutum DNA virus]
MENRIVVSFPRDRYIEKLKDRVISSADYFFLYRRSGQKEYKPTWFVRVPESSREIEFVPADLLNFETSGVTGLLRVNCDDPGDTDMVLPSDDILAVDRKDLTFYKVF